MAEGTLSKMERGKFESRAALVCRRSVALRAIPWCCEGGNVFPARLSSMVCVVADRTHIPARMRRWPALGRPVQATGASGQECEYGQQQHTPSKTNERGIHFRLHSTTESPAAQLSGDKPALHEIQTSRAPFSRASPPPFPALRIKKPKT